MCLWFSSRGSGGVVSQHVVSQHALQQVSRGVYPSMPCRFPGLHSGGKLRGLGGSPGPHLGGLQAHTQGGCPGPYQGVSRPAPGGSPGPHPGGYPSMHWGRPPRRLLHHTGMHSCLKYDSAWCSQNIVDGKLNIRKAYPENCIMIHVKFNLMISLVIDHI